MTRAVDALAPMVIAVPIIAACVLLATGRLVPRAAVDAVATLTGVAVIGLDAALLVEVGGGRMVVWSGGWTPSHGVTVGIALDADPFGAGFALLAAVLVTCALLYSWRYFDDVEAHFHIMLLLFLAGVSGFALAGDLFNMLVFFELIGAMGYALTAFKIEDEASVQGGFSFGVVNSLGAYLTLTGIGLLYSRTGQLGLAQLSAALAGHRPDALVAVAFVLVCTGWLVKAAAAPFHFWTADAEAVAPSPVCALFSAVMVELGVFGVARVYWTVFRGALPAADVRHALLTVGVLTAVVGAVMCLAQRSLKRLLAYSTIAHVGLFVTAVAVLTPDGLSGAAVYVLGHAGVKGSLFLLAGIVLNRYGSVDEAELWGRGLQDRLLGVLMLLDGLALAGLPPFGTGLGKALAETATSDAGYVWGPWLFIGVSALTGGAVLRATGRIFFGLGTQPARADAGSREEVSDEDEPETRERLTRLPASMLAAVLALMTGGLAVGVLPGLAPAVGAAAQRFTDTAGYIAQALHGAAAAPIPPHGTGWETSGVVLGLLSGALAVGVAALALAHDRLPSPVRSLGRAVEPLLRGAQSLHSGHVGDYVAWLFVGVAGLVALIGIPALT